MALKISIITPCFNAEKYIEQTIKSVLNQEYPNLEYIIIDGGSSDKTKQIVNKYKNKIDIIISEKDKGQYDAINKGLKLATGDVMAWLNADDVYFPWTLKTVNNIFQKFNEVNWIGGIPAFLNSEGCLTTVYNRAAVKPSKFIKNGYFRCNYLGPLQQESMFWRREVVSSCGMLDLNYPLAADFELWMRFAEKHDLYSLSLPLAAFRKHEGCRSANNRETYYNDERQACINKGKTTPLLGKIARINKKTNRLIRLFIKAKAPIIYYSVRSNSWLIKRKRASVSNVSLSTLLMEI